MKTLKTVKGRSGFSPKPIKPSMRHDNNENRGDTPVLKHPLPPNVFTRKRGGGTGYLNRFFFSIVSTLCLFLLECVCAAGAGLKEGGGNKLP